MSKPEIRFSESEHESVLLDSVSLILKGKGVSKGDISDSGACCIRYGELHTIYPNVITTIVSRTRTHQSQSILSKENDLLIPAAGEDVPSLCNIFLLRVPDVLLGMGMNIIRCYKLNPDFLFHYLRAPKGKYVISSLVQGVGTMNLTCKKLKTLSIRTPPNQEQEKIADFLGAVDKQIELLQKEKELFEYYKKILAQKIFSQELRFKNSNGSNYQEWTSSSIGDLFDFKHTNSFTRSNLQSSPGEVAVVHYGDIHTKLNYFLDMNKQMLPYVAQGVEFKNLKKDNYCRPGDIIIADVSEDYKGIGKAIEVINTHNYKISAGMHTLMLREKGHSFSLGFKGYLINSQYVKQQIRRIATGVSVLGVTKAGIASIDIHVPEKEEQEKIANLLDSVEEQANSIYLKVKLVEDYKKSLLDRMFV